MSLNLEVKDCFREEPAQKRSLPVEGRGERLCPKMKELEEVIWEKTEPHRE